MKPLPATLMALGFFCLSAAAGVNPAYGEGKSEADFLQEIPQEVAETALAHRLEPGDAIPEFSLSIGEGTSVETRESLSGKPAVLTFFALDNKIRTERSLKLLSCLDRLQGQFGDKARFFGICSDSAGCDTPPLKVSVLNDERRAAYTLFGIFMMPTTMVISPEGNLLAKLPYSAEAEDELAGWLRVALGEMTGDEYEASRQVSREPERTSEEKESLHHLQLARVMMERRMYSQAVQEFAAAAMLTPKDKSPLLEMGFAQLKLDNGNAAAETFTKVLDLDPDDMDAVGGLGLSLHSQGKDDEAVLELEDAAATVKPMPRVLIALAEIYAAQGKKDQSLSMYAKAFKRLERDLERCEGLEEMNP